MLNISVCTVTNNNGKLLQYSIESIVKYIDEILIFDDSSFDNDQNIFLEYLRHYENVIIFKTNEFGKDLGKKKQFLVNNAKHDIILRWDDDFILYDKQLLYEVYNVISDHPIDGILLDNFNIAYDINYLRKDAIYWNEICFFKKHYIVFDNKNGYLDYPCKTTKKLRLIHYKKPLFFHFWNFKCYEKRLIRGKLMDYLRSKIPSYFEWNYLLQNSNTNYNFNDIISYKKNELGRVKYLEIDENQWIVPDKQHKRIITKFKQQNKLLCDFLKDEYKLQSTNDNKFNFSSKFTFKLNSIYANKSNFFEDNVLVYLYEYLTGYEPELIDESKIYHEKHFVLSNIYETTPISKIWGHCFANKNINYDKDNIYCVTGLLSVNILKEENIIIPFYGEPILMLPLLYKPTTTSKEYIGIITNENDYVFMKDKYVNRKEIKVIHNQAKSIEKHIDMINECSLVLTSSISYVALCHGYNIPVFCVDVDKNMEYLFFDYFSGIYKNEFQLNLDLTIDIILENIDDYICNFAKPDLIEERQIDLIQSCPFVEEYLKPLLLKMV